MPSTRSIPASLPRLLALGGPEGEGAGDQDRDADGEDRENAECQETGGGDGQGEFSPGRVAPRSVRGEDAPECEEEDDPGQRLIVLGVRDRDVDNDHRERDGGCQHGDRVNATERDRGHAAILVARRNLWCSDSTSARTMPV